MKESSSTGIVYLGAQQVLACLVSLAIHLAAGRILGPEQYGMFSVVSAVLYTITLVFLTGVPLAGSKSIAADPRCAMSIRKKSLLIQGIAGVLAALALYLSAAPLASRLGNPELAPLLRIGAFSLPWLGLGYVYVYEFNGLRSFRRQASALVSLNLSKAGATLLFLFLGFGIAGAIPGLVASAAAFLAVAWWLGRGTVGSEPIAAGKLLRLGGQFALASLAVAVWGQLDLLMLEALGKDPRDVGLFTAASTLAWAPAALFGPILLVQFPAVSEASAAGDTRSIGQSLEKSLSLGFMLLCPLVVGAWVFAKPLLGLVYGPLFVAAAYAVGPLVFGVSFFTLYEIMDTYLRASGKTVLSLTITCSMLTLHFLSNLILIPRYQLLGVTLSAAVMSVVTCSLAGIFATRVMQLRVPWAVLARTLALSCLAFVPGFLWDRARPVEILLAIPCMILYVGLLLRFEANAATEARRIGMKAMSHWRTLARTE